MKTEKKYSIGPKLIMIYIDASIAFIAMAWPEIWKRGNKIEKLEKQVEVLKADKVELVGDIKDINETPIEYLLLYRRATLARFEKIEPRWDQIMETSWRLSKKYGVPAEITIAKMEHESFFNPSAIGPLGEYGLLQIYAPAWPQFDTARGFDIEYNLDFGIQVFAGCLKQANGDIREALRFYNGRGALPEGMLPYSDRVLSGRSMKIK